MSKFLFFLFVGFITFSYRLNAQLLKPMPIKYSYNIIEQKTFGQPVVGGENIFYLYNTVACSPLQISYTSSFKYTLPKGAIFCRMEDAIFKRLNFWVKFRMGTDDRYSN